MVSWYRAAVSDAANPPPAATAFTKQGYAVALVELCGFGTTGPRPDAGTLTGAGMAPEDMAHEMGRSVPGFHAGEITRVHRYLAGRPDVSSVVLAVVEDHIDVAMVHSILAAGGGGAADTLPAKVAIVGTHSKSCKLPVTKIHRRSSMVSWTWLWKHAFWRWYGIRILSK